MKIDERYIFNKFIINRIINNKILPPLCHYTVFTFLSECVGQTSQHWVLHESYDRVGFRSGVHFYITS
jgi:hypothetical protein